MKIAAMAVLLVLGGAGLASSAGATRLKELAQVEGARDNQLVGYGLVVGLNGTGDKRQTYFSAQTLANMLDRMGVQVNPNAILVRNMAAVMVTATLPPFAQPGSRIDIQVAAIGDATNLQGGVLVLTPLKAADGSTYAVGQGSVLTGGFVAGRGGGNSTTMNHPTSGRIPSGAIVERAVPAALSDELVRWQLRQADFTTSARVASAINARLPGAKAVSESASSIAVAVPGEYRGRLVEFIAEMERITVESDARLRVVINERTGTIALGKEIRIRPVAILHGNLSVEISTSYDVSQPAPLSDGTTTVVPQVNVGVKEELAKQVNLKEGSSVEDLVKALTAIGSSPRDIISVLQSLRAAGALDAELEVI